MAKSKAKVAEELLFEKRSVAAKKAWATRRANEKKNARKKAK